ncbi:hypothetical protein V6N13_124494 [Hibiscus sabdariffa]|uniref:Uncharacterized protein n=1 Tax=Hibiscus sabdariffa TaxID=183260 RepID=A0ABR2S2D2_9ROSI
MEGWQQLRKKYWTKTKRLRRRKNISITPGKRNNVAKGTSNERHLGLSFRGLFGNRKSRKNGTTQGDNMSPDLVEKSSFWSFTRRFLEETISSEKSMSCFDGYVKPETTTHDSA